MRSLEQVKYIWQELEQYRTVRELKDAVRLENRSSLATRGLRSFCWKTFLLFDTLDLATCQRTLTSSRSAYNTLRAHFSRVIDDADDVGPGKDPLSQQVETSPWNLRRKDEELRAEIWQDVERCMPEQEHFRKPEVQQMLLDVLFVYCKLNPDIGYRQGMHELLAPILWVLQDEAIDVGENSKALGEDAIIMNMFDAEHIEHDAFAIFGVVMQSSKGFYISDGPGSIASRSRHIYDDVLSQVDPDLKQHLDRLGVVPQVYLIRWIRLLFGREFHLHSVLALWDAIFAEDASLEVVDYICLAMLLRIRWDILDADHNGALTLLLRYPEPERDFPAQTLVFDAIRLRNVTNPESGSALVMKYTGRPISRAGRPVTPPALQRNTTAFSGFNARRGSDRQGAFSPPRTSLQARNLEAMLRNTAKSIHARSEKLGIGKAVRSAVEEVHRKAQEIRETQATTPSASWRRGGDPEGSTHLLDKIKIIENRNKRLSELLAGAVGELWEYQKSVTEGTKEPRDADGGENAIEKLSAAIAKVQFVQVYLDEPNLTLVEEEYGDAKNAQSVEDDRNQEDLGLEASVSSTNTEVVVPDRTLETAPSSKANDLGTSNLDGLADPSSFEDLESPNAAVVVEDRNSEKQARRDEVSAEPAGRLQTEAGSAVTRSSRPPLAQSEFSFMLGQDDHTRYESHSRPLEKSSGSPGKLDSGKNYLFGYDEKNHGSLSRLGVEDQRNSQSGNDEFDIASLRRAKRAPG